jgi:hypothetical protein
LFEKLAYAREGMDFPKSLGMLPERLLPNRLMEVKEVIFEMVCGNSPWSWLVLRSRICSSSNFQLLVVFYR